jgi:hypothetical protein
MSRSTLSNALRAQRAAIGFMTVTASAKNQVAEVAATSATKLIVFADHLTPAQGTFAFALDWARRLQCGIQVVVDNSHDNELAAVCKEACEQHGCACEKCSGNNFERERGSGRVFFIGHDTPVVHKAITLQRVLRDAGSGLLVCPNRWTPWIRALLVNHESDRECRSLVNDVRFCGRFGACVIVLTVARSERLARLQEEVARKALYDQGLAADFDCLVGPGIGGEVLNVALWRRCQLVVLPRPAASPWWRWHRGHPWQELLTTQSETSSAVTLLTLPQSDEWKTEFVNHRGKRHVDR